MSRIGRSPITVPAGVTVKVDESNLVTVKGPKGELSRQLHKDMAIEQEGNVITIKRPSDDKEHRSLHGLTRTLLQNMVTGVTNGFSKTLEIAGVGYRAAKSGTKLALTLGFSHPLEIVPPKGITIEVPAPNKIVVSGSDKEAVGELAAKIRSYREPEPYKGKGIKYEGEFIRRKVGKAGGKGKK
ncbi:MAG TPA: 50S ribosomal protein L6 [Methylomusa anaerophila]|uniref:Large ribosomal subunit protein uL6 n=1 Tax=Methylomusa anaerophila TaxID=1930071 RepID=A0A348AJX6_9FIRM|nr:50S ribosomal protein L6 [Methylomusa anaerophila]BBB91374.1 50S ribosomal protein L6 [Methylomusa anaerophila]HML90202.1 50S ribosomal protein L6 [Methylomusa anaerophila]